MDFKPPPTRMVSNSGATILVVLILLVEFLLWGDALEYRRALLLSNPWRLFTGHFAHLSLMHAMVNAVALLLLTQLFSDRLRAWEQWAVLLGTPVIISLVFWIAMPGLIWYRGLSGVLHAFYFAGCVVWLMASSGRARWLPIAALAGGTIKVLFEQPWSETFPWANWLGAPVVPQAHLIGALVGTAAGLLLAARRKKQQAEQP
ncbi:MAG: rhombosortase [Lysobacterales bacterium]|nr:MAG: rhombosortase [Xanthomonadales bacterium]